MGTQNSVKKGVLHTINGAFSSKWASVSKECGQETGVLEYDWGKGVQSEDVDEKLSSGRYDVFAMVHNETSTGAMSNLEAISKLFTTFKSNILNSLSKSDLRFSTLTK